MCVSYSSKQKSPTLVGKIIRRLKYQIVLVALIVRRQKATGCEGILTAKIIEHRFASRGILLVRIKHRPQNTLLLGGTTVVNSVHKESRFDHHQVKTEEIWSGDRLTRCLVLLRDARVVRKHQDNPNPNQQILKFEHQVDRFDLDLAKQLL